MDKNLFSTFQAAAILGVKPDTVLKWIKSGKVPASRTLGGHYRIRRDTVVELISERASQDLPPKPPPLQKPFQYCWEFNAKDTALRNDCRRCLVYRTRAKLCYEMNSVPKKLGHLKLYCGSNCEDCDYYTYAKEHALNVLVVTDDAEFLKGEKNSGRIFSFKITSCEYECSAIVEKTRPDFAIIDCSFGKARDFCDYLANDSRVPYVRLILASNTDVSFEYGSKKVIGHISKPLTIEQVEECITGLST